MSRNVLSTILLRFFIVVHKFHYYYALWRNAPFLPLNNKNRQPIMPFAVLLSVFLFFSRRYDKQANKTPLAASKFEVTIDRSRPAEATPNRYLMPVRLERKKKKRRRCTLRARWSHFQQCWYSATLVLRGSTNIVVNRGWRRTRKDSRAPRQLNVKM